MDISIEDADCIVEAGTPSKKKKMKQAQLPFQMLSSSKSPSTTDNVPNKKKRKVKSPLISNNPKMVKLSTKENLLRDIHEKESEAASERKLNSSNDSVEIISDDEKKDLEQSDQQKIGKSDNTPKRKRLEKNKKLDKSLHKPGALTKFLKKMEVEESNISHDNNLSELKDKKDSQDTSIHKGKNQICSNESSDVPSVQPDYQQDISQLSETDDSVTNKAVDSSLPESDCDITILSSDNETSSELDKSILNKSKETTEIPVTPKTDKDTKNKIKKLTPKQLEKRREIARKKEEKLKLRMEKEKKTGRRKGKSPKRETRETERKRRKREKRKRTKEKGKRIKGT